MSDNVEYQSPTRILASNILGELDKSMYVFYPRLNKIIISEL